MEGLLSATSSSGDTLFSALPEEQAVQQQRKYAFLSSVTVRFRGTAGLVQLPQSPDSLFQGSENIEEK